MDFIRSFDIRLEKDVYYAGETLNGLVSLENAEPIKIRGIRVFLRGRARVQWKVLKSGESRTIKDDQYLLDEKSIVWGKDRHEEEMQILPRGLHQLPFQFQLPPSQMPASLETKAGTVRYYVKVIIDIPYASSPQGLKYFTFVGPHIDCMEEKYLSSMCGQDHKIQCFRCCQRGIVALRVVLERTAYCCGEGLCLRAHIENRQDFIVCLCVRLFQNVEYRIERGGVAETKLVTSTVLEHRTPKAAENSQCKFNYGENGDPGSGEPAIRIPVIPPTNVGVCRLIQIYYVLKVCMEDERKNESLEMEFPLTIATVPYRSTHSPVYSVTYEFCVDYVETGKYISPEFRLGQVYDGTTGTTSVDEPIQNGGINNNNNNDFEEVILYRPVYVKVASERMGEKLLAAANIANKEQQQNMHQQDDSLLIEAIVQNELIGDAGNAATTMAKQPTNSSSPNWRVHQNVDSIQNN